MRPRRGRRGERNGYGIRWWSVSILVLLDHPLGQPEALLGADAEALISILVLLDHPLGPAWQRLRARPDAGFRSLFSWIILSDNSRSWPPSLTPDISILV